MGWQDEVREILERSDWPPKAGAVARIPGCEWYCSRLPAGSWPTS